MSITIFPKPLTTRRWGDIMEGFTDEECATFTGYRDPIVIPDPFAICDQKVKDRQKAEVLRAFYYDHYDGHPPLKCLCCNHGIHTDPPDHFTEEDRKYCCSICRLSKGRSHGGKCQKN